MKFSASFLAVLSSLSVVLAIPAQLDVYAPPLLTPTAGTVWIVGTVQTVTWDVSNPPKQITNPNGMIVLEKPDGRLDIDHPLAANFNILNGSQNVTVPDVPTADNYRVVLFGDSGNSGAPFRIEKN